MPAADWSWSLGTDCGCWPNAGQTPARLCAQTAEGSRGLSPGGPQGKQSKPAKPAAGEAGEAGEQPGKQVKRALYRERLSDAELTAEDCELPTGFIDRLGTATSVGLSETSCPCSPGS